MNNYFVTIGLEIHVAVLSNRKMFSTAPNMNNALANTCVDWLDLGLPGTLPVVNLGVIHKAFQLAHFWQMEVNYQNISFDRKNYFYFDLPKGYQITQYFNPVAQRGQIFLPQNQQTIQILQIQIEEDTAKQIKANKTIQLDYNRSGAPLLEIVTNPDFHDVATVQEFLVHLKRTLEFLQISDAKIELGNLRVDVNISISPNSDQLGTKVEIKNIGSFFAITQAIEYEIQRQTKILEAGQVIEQQTRKWNEAKQQTQFMRTKSSAVGYYFMPEPNIPNFGFSSSEYEEIVSQTPVNWLTIEANLQIAGLAQVDVNNLLDHYQLYLLFAQIDLHLANPKKAYKWAAIEILGQIKKRGWDLVTVPSNLITELIVAIKNLEIAKTLNGKQIKAVFDVILDQNITCQEAIDQLGLKQITDLNYLKSLVQEILNQKQEQLTQLLSNPQKLEKLVIGQIMAKTQAQANPHVAKQAFLETIAPLLIGVQKNE